MTNAENVDIQRRLAIDICSMSDRRQTFVDKVITNGCLAGVFYLKPRTYTPNVTTCNQPTADGGAHCYYECTETGSNSRQRVNNAQRRGGVVSESDARPGLSVTCVPG